MTEQISKPKHPIGRPTKYKPEYCQAIIDYFSIPQTKQLTKTYYTKAGTTIEEPIEKPNDLPFLEDFAWNICGVPHTTMLQWVNKYPDFRIAYTRAKELQKAFMVRNGISGLYPPAAYAFTAKNITDMRDKTEIDASLSITSWSMALEPKEKKSKTIKDATAPKLLQNIESK